jgi:cinnamyl-alcohol dehydrogenase
MGHHVIFLSPSYKKMEEALEHLGADVFLASSSATEMEKAANTLDYILDAVPVVHTLWNRTFHCSSLKGSSS